MGKEHADSSKSRNNPDKKSLYQLEVEKKYNKYLEIFDKHLSTAPDIKTLVEHQLNHLSVLSDVSYEYYDIDLSIYIDVLDLPKEFYTKLQAIAYRRYNEGSRYITNIISEYKKESLKKSDELRLNIEFDALKELKHDLEDMLIKKRGDEVILRKDILTHKQQMLIIYYLQKSEIFKAIKISQDVTKQSRLIHALLNRNNDNTQTYMYELQKTDISKNLMNETNLNKILIYFEQAGLESAIELIKKDIKKLNSK